MIGNIVGSLFWLLLVPMAIGKGLLCTVNKGRTVDWMVLPSGYICMWAIFQCLAVPLILLQRVGASNTWQFPALVWIYGVMMVLLALAGVFLTWKCGKKPSLKVYEGKTEKKVLWLWAAFFLLVLLQIGAMIFLAFADGDDAYYVAVSAITKDSNTMYLKQVYTGGTSSLDLRYSLAPMPVWISFLSCVTGVHTAVLSHLLLPIVLLCVTYCIYGKIAQIICEGNKSSVAICMVGIGLLITFGNYSFKTVETFLLTRTAQGKSILGNVILPFLVLLFILILQKVKERKAVEIPIWMLFLMTSAAGCLCSSLGGVLVVVFAGITGFYGSIVFRRKDVLMHFVSGCVPALFFIALYLFEQGI